MFGTVGPTRFPDCVYYPFLFGVKNYLYAFGVPDSRVSYIDVIVKSALFNLDLNLEISSVFS